MKKYSIRFGLYSAALLTILFALTWGIWGTSLGYRTSEWIGYLSMLVALSLIFFGIRTYKNEQLDGRISFGSAFKMGALTALIPALGFFLYTIVFFKVAGQEFTDYALENMPQEQKEQMAGNMELFLNPFFQGFIMFLTVFFIGLIIALISALLLGGKNKLKTEGGQ
ncbi:MAG TPA: DUF4199 domain-containing protein [Saprospiraceae bacterium]|nr:DUF4199 domain-containing protein [Saprospiraceae bacterium]HMQ85449.1 DUF4199 domain-containing protein [Saprospiraceae bacterium]